MSPDWELHTSLSRKTIILSRVCYYHNKHESESRARAPSTNPSEGPARCPRERRSFLLSPRQEGKSPAGDVIFVGPGEAVTFCVVFILSPVLFFPTYSCFVVCLTFLSIASVCSVAFAYTIISIFLFVFFIFITLVILLFFSPSSPSYYHFGYYCSLAIS